MAGKGKGKGKGKGRGNQDQDVVEIDAPVTHNTLVIPEANITCMPKDEIKAVLTKNKDNYDGIVSNMTSLLNPLVNGDFKEIQAKARAFLGVLMGCMPSLPEDVGGSAPMSPQERALLSERKKATYDLLLHCANDVLVLLAERAMTLEGAALVRLVTERMGLFLALVNWLVVNPFAKVDPAHSQPTNPNQAGLRFPAERPAALASATRLVFKQVVFDPVRPRLREAIFKVVHDKRTGVDNMDDISGAGLDLFVKMGVDATDPAKVVMDVYTADFEKQFVQATKDFYALEAAKWVGQLSASDYLKHAEECINQETARVQFLPRASRSRVMEVVDASVLKDHQHVLMERPESGLLALLANANDKRDELRRMHRMFKRLEPEVAAPEGITLGPGQQEALAIRNRQAAEAADERERLARENLHSVHGLAPIVVLFGQFIYQKGLELHRDTLDALKAAKEAKAAKAAKAKEGGEGGGGGGGGGGAAAAAAAPAAASASSGPDNSTNPLEKYAIQVSELCAHFQDLVMTCFESLRPYTNVMRTQFEEIVARDFPEEERTIPELLALYFDSLLRDKHGGASEEEQDAQSLKLVRVLHYVSEKDKFLEFYRQLMCKRLLSGKSASNDLERSVIGKLKNAHGPSFTAKLEGMLSDFDAASTHKKRYEDTYFADQEQGNREMMLLPVVLALNFWPTQPSAPDFRLPEPMMLAMSVFTQRYLNDRLNTANSSRKLHWVHSLGTVVLQGQYPGLPRPYEISMTTYQASVLLTLQDLPASGITVREMGAAVGLPINDTKNAVASLSHKLFRLINKTGGSSPNEDDVITLNPAFRSNKGTTKFSIPAATLRLSKDDSKAAKESVNADRKYRIEAAVVRTMKERKTLRHPELVGEVISAISRLFNPEVADIKRVVDDLISREYLRRDEKDRGIYHYVA